VTVGVGVGVAVGVGVGVADATRPTWIVTVDPRLRCSPAAGF
jgi:hypothetical protein